MGQDLADLIPENVAIELQGSDFAVHGLCTAAKRSAE